MTLMTAAIVQARLSSTRFPRKVLATLDGQPMLARVIERAALIRGVDLVVVALPIAEPPFDVPTTTPRPVVWLRPSREPDDVLGRYADAAREVGADTIVRITSDCPCFDPQVGSLVLDTFWAMRPSYSYISNVYPRRTWPDGLDVEVFTRHMLLRADAEATRAEDREHVTPWIRRHVHCYNVELPVDWSWVRLTVDTEEDLAWIRTALRAPRSS